MKKMIFLYIVNYADESESAILAINTFLKDLKNNNPKIRGLALRSLCSLKYLLFNLDLKGLMNILLILCMILLKIHILM